MTSEVEGGQSVIVYTLDKCDEYFTHPRLDIRDRVDPWEVLVIDVDRHQVCYRHWVYVRGGRVLILFRKNARLIRLQ